MYRELLFIPAILGFLMIGNFSAFIMDDQGTAQQKELEAFLKTAKVVDIEVGGMGGRNEPWRITLNAGKTTRKGIFKYQDRPAPGFFPVSYKREIAAYELTKLFKMDIVPPVVEREIIRKKNDSPRKGSLQIMVEDCVNEMDRRARKLEPPNANAFENAMEELNVFENLTYCRRDVKDILVHKDTWKVCRVDFMEAFDTLSELLPETTISRCSRRLYQGLQLDPKVIETAMKLYLTPKAIQVLLVRRNMILEKIKELIKDKGEAAVLFDIKP
jgi:hypothetical protein